MGLRAESRNRDDLHSAAIPVFFPGPLLRAIPAFLSPTRLVDNCDSLSVTVSFLCGLVQALRTKLWYNCYSFGTTSLSRLERFLMY